RTAVIAALADRLVTGIAAIEAVIVAVVGRLASGGQAGIDRAVAVAVGALDRTVGNHLLAAHQRQNGAVAAIDVGAGLQVPVGIDEGGLIGQVDGDGASEVDVALVPAEQAADPFRRITR